MYVHKFHKNKLFTRKNINSSQSVAKVFVTLLLKIKKARTTTIGVVSSAMRTVIFADI